jgi:hypothetical protein
VHPRLDHLLQPVLQDAAASDPEEDRHTEKKKRLNILGEAFIMSLKAKAIATTVLGLFLATKAYASGPWFSLMNEFYGDAGAIAQKAVNQHRLNGVTFHTILTAGEQTFLSANPGAALAYFATPSEANVSSCYPASMDDNAGALLTGYTSRRGYPVWRVGSFEFDQAGGCWANGRPDFAGSDTDNYNSFINYYMNTKGFGTYLNQPWPSRGYKWMSVAVFSLSVQYAYDMGSDIVLLERNNDSVDGITPGLAMIRGAANQHGGKDWGIDISTWRDWSNGPTEYANGRLTTGWSTSTFKRNMFISYMGGANVLHVEATDYTTGAAPGQTLNPQGLLMQQFYDFAVTRHPNRGMPYVPMAIMQDHYSGFEPKYGEWQQWPYKWYWNIPYSQGDTMLANLLSLIYPNYNLWGTLPAGSPKVLNTDGSINISATQSAYQNALASKADPRPWEPMGSSQWGETFDFITNQSSLAPLLKYKVIVLATGAPMSDTLLGTLSQYVHQGGILVLNALQLSANAQTLAGVMLSTSRASATSETWVPDGSTIGEKPYNYSVVIPTTATVISQTSGNPIVTQNHYGAGTVYVTTPDFLENNSASKILNVGQKLLASLQSRFAIAAVNGPQLEYLVNTDGNSIIVTLINTNLNGAVWNGTISFLHPTSSYSVSEWIQDSQVPSSVQYGQVVINATVPAYHVRVYALAVK